MSSGSVRFVVYSALWVVTAVTGVCLHAGVDAAPAHASTGPRTRPRIAELNAPDGAPLIIMALHPRCPCSPASIDELRALRARCDAATHVAVLICTPADSASDAATSTEWDEAFDRMSARFDRETVIRDRSGTIAASLGLHASGATLMYDAGGHLTFSGGLTLARGMAGANPTAVNAVQSLSASTDVCLPDASSPVYGCTLISPQTGVSEAGSK
jgi:hypothetical protein